jgi:hypothetical protein
MFASALSEAISPENIGKLIKEPLPSAVCIRMALKARAAR